MPSTSRPPRARNRDADRDRDRDTSDYERERQQRRRKTYVREAMTVEVLLDSDNEKRDKRKERARDGDGDAEQPQAGSPSKSRPKNRDSAHRERDRERERSKRRERERDKEQSRETRRAYKYDSDHSGSNSKTTGSGSAPLSMKQLAALDKMNSKLGWSEYDKLRPTPPRQLVDEEDDAELKERERRRRKEERRRQREQDAERERRLADEDDDVEFKERERRRRREDRRRQRAEEDGERDRQVIDDGDDAELIDREKRRRTDGWRRGREEEGAARESNGVSMLDKMKIMLGWSAYQDANAAPARQSIDDDDAALTERNRRQRGNGTDRGVDRDRGRNKDRRRVVSGHKLERGGRSASAYYSEKEEFQENVRLRGGGSGGSGGSFDWEEEERKRKRRRNICIILVAVIILILAIAIPVGVVVSKKGAGSSSSSSGGGGGNTSPSNSNLDGISESDIPANVRGTYLDPFTWYDTEGFNVTYTPVTVGGLSIMGINSTWDDSAQANPQVPPLNQTWDYDNMKIHGINVGGWLSIEPFITPSLFSGFTTHDNVVDEWTLSATLGPTKAKSTIEQHYATFITEDDFAQIQAAGFDHVRIPFSYWAVTTYEGDPYVPNISWRYLLRAIEWARKYGIRVNLDLHGAPGSQNGWNHSGHQGLIGWLNGTDGALNGQRTIDIHKQLSTFFAQPRYKNVITMYGLVNEPRMVELDPQTVIAWTQSAYNAVRANNFTGIVIFGDGFMGLEKWKGVLQGNPGLLLDVHQYVIFNTGQIVLNHHDKINFACGGWTAQSQQSMNTATGFGPTLCGEWSQADTDCAQYLNNVGVGSRWEGTLNMASTPGGSNSGSVLNPTCPTHNNPRCSCTNANASPSSYSPVYIQWLRMFAEAQMYSFEQAWGWFYWTWHTESAAQWSYKDGIAAGTMPKIAYQRDFNCSQEIPDFASLGLSETY